jgi:diguanylate cyclase (GGDEF)-like protein
MINHTLVGLALVLARGITWRQSGVLSIDSLLPDFTLSCLGYVVAVLAKLSPWLTLPALMSLVLLYRALTIPQLKYEAQTDGKTGLLNARHFTNMLLAEIERAKRFKRPMTLIMADLDFLRNVNNTYGHLAGDMVLAGIGRIILENTRDYDIAGRFGGEEFAIALPETGSIEGQGIAERLRVAVEETAFAVETSALPISVTMSLGVTCYPDNAIESTGLIHDADMAVYQAKLLGRNRVVCSWDLPEPARQESGPLSLDERLGTKYTTGFLLTGPLNGSSSEVRNTSPHLKLKGQGSEVGR